MTENNLPQKSSRHELSLGGHEGSLIARGLAAIRQPAETENGIATTVRPAIPPEELVPMLASYEAELLKYVKLIEDEIDSGVEPQKASMQCFDDFMDTLKGATPTSPPHLVSIAFDIYGEEGEEIGDMAHGYYFKYFALKREKTADPTTIASFSYLDIPQTVNFKLNEDGVTAAFFLAYVMPSVGAFSHGLYKAQKLSIIETREKLDELLDNGTFDLEESDLADFVARRTPVGLCIRQEANSRLTCKCLCTNDEGSLILCSFDIDPQGRLCCMMAHTLVSTNRVLY